MNVSETSEWFLHQLTASGDGFAWSVWQVPAARLAAQPPRGLGEWSALRHAFHMLYYEREISLPSIHQWLGAPALSGENLDEDAAWTAEGGRDAEALLADFTAVRAREVELLSRFAEDSWQQVRQAVWGPVSLHWIVSKTYQHTAEHTSDVLRIALFWDHFASSGG